VTNPYAPPQRGRDGAPRPVDRPEDAHRHEPARHPDRPPTPDPPPPDPVALRAATRQVLHFALLLLAALATSSLLLPWQVIALVLTLAALVVGVRAMVTVIRLRVRGTLAPALGVGLGLAALLALSLTTALALWPLQMQLQECQRDALTISATQACQTQFDDALRDRLDTTPPAGG